MTIIVVFLFDMQRLLCLVIVPGFLILGKSMFFRFRGIVFGLLINKKIGIFCSLVNYSFGAPGAPLPKGGLVVLSPTDEDLK